jgi:hypothetical protein
MGVSNWIVLQGIRFNLSSVTSYCVVYGYGSPPDVKTNVYFQGRKWPVSFEGDQTPYLDKLLNPQALAE